MITDDSGGHEHVSLSTVSGPLPRGHGGTSVVTPCRGLTQSPDCCFIPSLPVVLADLRSTDTMMMEVHSNHGSEKPSSTSFLQAYSICFCEIHNVLEVISLETILVKTLLLLVNELKSIEFSMEPLVLNLYEYYRSN